MSISTQISNFASGREKSKPGRYHYLIAASGVMGLLTGGVTYLLNLIIAFISGRVMALANPLTGNWIFLASPVVGVLLTVVYTRYVVRLDISHGTDHIRDYLNRRIYKLPPRLMWSSVVASSLTLGFGGSAGAEGPSAYTGAAIGSNIGRAFRLTDSQLRMMVGIGAGAGIAGIFRSPIGGVLFTLEVLRMPLGTLPVLALIVGCTTAGLTSYLLAGSTFDVVMLDAVFPKISDLPFVILLGVICGLYSVYYSYVMKYTRVRLKGINNVWRRALLSGAMIGLAVYIFPTLYATGYGSLGDILNSDNSSMLEYSLFSVSNPRLRLLMCVAAGIIVIKPFACSATNNGGGVSGNFAPTLFAGGFAGFVFATVMNHFLGYSLHIPNYIYFGMAGAMAGIIRAPLMAMFLTTEMAGHSNFLWPLAIVSVISWLTAHLIAPKMKI